MLNETTLERLKALNLDTLAEAWLKQQAEATMAAIPFDERLGLLVDAEWLHRENKRMKRSLAELLLPIISAWRAKDRRLEANTTHIEW